MPISRHACEHNPPIKPAPRREIHFRSGGLSGGNLRKKEEENIHRPANMRGVGTYVRVGTHTHTHAHRYIHIGIGGKTRPPTVSHLFVFHQRESGSFLLISYSPSLSQAGEAPSQSTRIQCPVPLIVLDFK